MFNRQILLALPLLFAGQAWADTPSCVATDCAALGYTKTTAQCSGAATIKCPFDTSKVMCADTFNTPLATYLADTITTVTGTSPSALSLSTSLDDFTAGGWDTEYFGVCEEFQGERNLTCEDTDEFAAMSTFGDMITWAENYLMNTSSQTDPCAGAIKYDPEVQTCAKICTGGSTAHMCLETPHTLTCQEAVTNAGGVILSSSSSQPSELVNVTYYLTSDINYKTRIGKLNNAQFNAAAILQPCKNDSSVAANPSLRISDITITSGDIAATFNVDTTISSTQIVSGGIDIGFGASLTMNSTYVGGGTEDSPTEVSIYFNSSSRVTSSGPYTASITMFCDMSGEGEYCSLELDDDGVSTIKYDVDESTTNVNCLSGNCTRI